MDALRAENVRGGVTRAGVNEPGRPDGQNSARHDDSLQGLEEDS